MMNEKQASIIWERFRESIRKSTPVDLSESIEEQKKRITKLEADPQAWKRYYLANYYSCESPDFQINASKRLHRQFKKNKHWYEVRHWARGLAKTTDAMGDFMYLTLTGQLSFIILTSSTWDAAAALLTKIQCQLDSNQRIIRDYGKQELPGSWTNGDFTTKKGVRWLALGAGQSPRGQSNESIRPDGIMVDDFDTDEDCRNPDTINKKWEWFERALLFTVDVARPFLVLWLGNIIAEDCCVVRASKMADHSEIVNIRDQDGLSVWPQKNSEADIDYMLNIVSYESGQQEYFNNPIRAGQVFKEMTFGDLPPMDKLPFVVIYADPATSNKDRPAAKSKATSSTKSISIIGSHNAIQYGVYKCFVDAVTNATFISWLFEAYLYCKAAGAKAIYVYIENNTLQDPFYEQALMPLIYQESKLRGFMLPITPDTRKKPEKYFRIEAKLEPMNRLGNLILNKREKDNPHMERMVAQFKSVSPNSKTMDGPDSVEGGVVVAESKQVVTNTSSMVLGPRRSHSKRF